MKTKSLFVLSKERHAGTLFIALGLMEILRRYYKRIAFFKPITESPSEDDDIATLLETFGLSQESKEAWAVTESDARSLLYAGDEERLYELIIERYELLKSGYDFVLCAGFGGESSAPVAGVVSARERSLEDAQETDRPFSICSKLPARNL